MNREKRRAGRAIRKARRLERERQVELERQLATAIDALRRIWAMAQRFCEAVAYVAHTAARMIREAFALRRSDYVLAPPRTL